ncbi:hypothetical protein TEU_02315 [Thermococcus eurythermalis]|uniref:Amidophosphoribosyltransferase n=2 Tax=Thermococcus eurythermalis TaxID=1505907 RepID=A0A097QS15_9EURY|nr:hypothetical protein TEU_02315 [Thermococcus eurythermalis]
MIPKQTPEGIVFKCRYCKMEVLVTEDGERVIKPPLKVPNHHSETLWVNGHSVPFYYLGYYIPKRRGYPDEFSQQVLEFKQGYPFIVSRFAEEVVNLIRFRELEPDIIVPIPRSSAGKIGLGHRQLAEYISRTLGIRNGTGVLVRKISVPSAHLARSLEERPNEALHNFSISCTGDIQDLRVLLFDDILTTGATAMACIKKLFRCGASEVYLITLAKTGMG